jgi:HPt (histidine-containing phosphotransfer) domain-containing protein
MTSINATTTCTMDVQILQAATQSLENAFANSKPAAHAMRSALACSGLQSAQQSHPSPEQQSTNWHISCLPACNL